MVWQEHRTSLVLLVAFMVTAIALAVLVLETRAVEAETLVAGDGVSLTSSRAIEFLPLTALAGVFGVLGIPLVCDFVAIGVGFFAVSRRRYFEAGALVVGAWLTNYLASALKEDIARPRPSDPVVDVHGFSFPSSHATVSVLYVAVALVLAGLLRSGRSRLVVFCLGVVTMLGIGLCTVYLRGHYMSDVIGGWALGLAVFTPLVAIAYLLDMRLSGARQQT